MSTFNVLLIVSSTIVFSAINLAVYYLNQILKIIRKKKVEEHNSSEQKIKTIISTKTLKEIQQVNEDGFGDKSNRYAFAMESFKGKLYVGTSHIKNPIPGIYQFAGGNPLKTDGSQLYCYDDTEVCYIYIRT